MAKRAFDLVFSSLALLLSAPLLLVSAAGIRLSDPGPVLFKALRQGQGNRQFTIYKFRTMRVGGDKAGAISALNDGRVFRFGRFLRRTKLDELPQFWNVLKGDMSVVGPRPEDIEIVRRSYTDEQKRTLSVRPGIASPGSLLNYTHAQDYLSDDDVLGSYEKNLLPVKLGLELVYVDNASLAYDLRIVARTMVVIARKMCGIEKFALPPEYAIAKSKGYINA